MKLPGLTAFLPCFNDEACLRKALPALLAELPRRAETFEVAVVLDERSRDGSRAFLEEAGRTEPVRIIAQAADDPGYGRALALGWAGSRMPWTFYTDADLQYSPGDLGRLVALADEADLVAGWRRRRVDPPARLLTAATYNRLVDLFFGLGIRDVDCSFKLVRTEAVQTLNFLSRSGAAEVELFLQARQSGWRVRQVPVRHFARPDGRSAFDRGRLSLPDGGNVRQVWRELRELKRRFPRHA